MMTRFGRTIDDRFDSIMNDDSPFAFSDDFTDAFDPASDKTDRRAKALELITKQKPPLRVLEPEWFAATCDQGSASAEILLAECECRYAKGDMHAAAEMASRLLSGPPLPPIFLTQVRDAAARAFLGDGQQQKALDVALQQMQNKQADSSLHRLVARIYTSLGRHAEAQATLLKALAKYRKNPFFWFDLGKLLALSGDSLLAQFCFLRVLLLISEAGRHQAVCERSLAQLQKQAESALEVLKCAPSCSHTPTSLLTQHSVTVEPSPQHAGSSVAVESYPSRTQPSSSHSQHSPSPSPSPSLPTPSESYTPPSSSLSNGEPTLSHKAVRTAEVKRETKNVRASERDRKEEEEERSTNTCTTTNNNSAALMARARRHHLTDELCSVLSRLKSECDTHPNPSHVALVTELDRLAGVTDSSGNTRTDEGEGEGEGEDGTVGVENGAADKDMDPFTM